MAKIGEALRGMVSAEDLNELTSLTGISVELNGMQSESAVHETVTSGACAIGGVTRLSVTGTQAYTLADGTRVGQRKDLYCSVAATTPDGVVTPVNFTDGTTISFDAVGEQCTLSWSGSAWELVSLTGATVA